VGAVVGATVADLPPGLAQDLHAFNGPILAPGFGAQGADPSKVAELYGAALPLVTGVSARAIAAAGPDVEDVRAGIVRMSGQLRAALSR
jgi:orotidine-5'-phosphate decarboxylase